mmetsp:Transcript_26540/g.54766  ORF Transcript_26540/g.54766 Transcript_26540/m.54766 type:complete len:265 (+) Transcript_26540:709-1503(+)
MHGAAPPRRVPDPRFSRGNPRRDPPVAGVPEPPCPPATRPPPPGEPAPAPALRLVLVAPLPVRDNHRNGFPPAAEAARRAGAAPGAAGLAPPRHERSGPEGAVAPPPGGPGGGPLRGGPDAGAPRSEGDRPAGPGRPDPPRPRQKGVSGRWLGAETLGTGVGLKQRKTNEQTNEQTRTETIGFARCVRGMCLREHAFCFSPSDTVRSLCGARHNTGIGARTTVRHSVAVPACEQFCAILRVRIYLCRTRYGTTVTVNHNDVINK